MSKLLLSVILVAVMALITVPTAESARLYLYIPPIPKDKLPTIDGFGDDWEWLPEKYVLSRADGNGSLGFAGGPGGLSDFDATAAWSMWKRKYHCQKVGFTGYEKQVEVQTGEDGQACFN